MRPRLSALLWLSAFVIPVVGCSETPTKITPTAEKPSTNAPGEVAQKPGVKTPKKPKDITKSVGPSNLVQ